MMLLNWKQRPLNLDTVHFLETQLSIIPKLLSYKRYFKINKSVCLFSQIFPVHQMKTKHSFHQNHPPPSSLRPQHPSTPLQMMKTGHQLLLMKTGEESFENAEDSILTSFRRKHLSKYNALERKMRQPLKENVNEQFNILKNLHKRKEEDLQQSCIIINYIEDKFKSSTEPARKHVKFSSL